MTPGFRSRVALPLSAFALLAAAPVAPAAPPTVRNMDLHGLQIGATTVLTIDGDNLLPEPKLLLAAPIAKQVVRPTGTPNRVVIEVTLDRAAVPGLYNLRLNNAHGVSATRVVAVDHLPQRAWEEKTALPVALHGALAGSGRLKTSFDAKAGQALLCEVEAQRLGGKLRPVIHLLDESGRQLTWAWPSPALSGDGRIATTLPADGRYTVEVHDRQYAASGGNFRLRLGAWQYADAAFPPAVRRGESASVELIGQPSDRKVAVHPVGDASVLPVPWADPAAASGMRPRILVSDLPEYVGKDGPAMVEVPEVPAAFNGRLSRAGAIGRFRLKVRPRDQLRFDVFADRLGSPCDALLKLQRDEGALLAQADDGPEGADHGLDFTVPAGLQNLVISVEDLHGRGGANFIYRVVVRPLAAPAREFRLSVPAGEINVPAAGTHIVEVGVERHGYTGPVRLSFDSLAAGVAVSGTDVPANATGALLTFTGAAATPGALLTPLRGTPTEPKATNSARAHEENHPLRKLQPWLAEELAVALTAAEPLAFAARWGNLPADARLVLGGSLKVPLAVTPPKGDYGGVRLSLLSSHRPPRVNGQPDLNQALRKDLGPFLELPAGKNDGEFLVLIPPTLPAVPQDVAFRAELLSRDRKRVVAQAFTPKRRFAAFNPLVVQPAAKQIEVPLDPKTGAEVKVAGKIARLAGFQGAVTVSLTGLPPGIAVPAAALQPAHTDFQFTFRLPTAFKPQELDKIEIFATGNYDAKSVLPNRSEPVAVRVKLLPPPALKK
jgi:hypothetical protein